MQMSPAPKATPPYRPNITTKETASVVMCAVLSILVAASIVWHLRRRGLHPGDTPWFWRRWWAAAIARIRRKDPKCDIDASSSFGTIRSLKNIAMENGELKPDEKLGKKWSLGAAAFEHKKDGATPWFWRKWWTAAVTRSWRKDTNCEIDASSSFGTIRSLNKFIVENGELQQDEKLGKGWDRGPDVSERRDLPQETDITLGHYTGSLRSTKEHTTAFKTAPYIPFFTDGEADITTMLAINAAVSSVWKRMGRDRKGSEASQSTTTTTEYQGSLYAQSEPRSSTTSVASVESEADLEEVEVVYEVKRAQTQSMEVKKGVLLSWRSSRPGDIADMPSVLTVGDTNSLIRAGRHTPSVIVTCPSSNSLDSTTSSVTVDLDDFPAPPRLVVAETKRTTLEQVIGLYQA